MTELIISKEAIVKVCVFLSSTLGNNQAYSVAAKMLGTELAEYGHELIYGGVKMGLMGIMANAALSQKGTVIGVTSKEFHNSEVTHMNLSKLFIEDDMTARIAKEVEISDVFVAFPGGIGTLDEFFKVWTLNKTKQIIKPLYLLNINEIFNPLILLINNLTDSEFIKPSEKEMITICNSVHELMQNINNLKKETEEKLPGQSNYGFFPMTSNT